MMKQRLLSFAVILALIVGSSCFSAGAAGFTDTDKTRYEKAANVLSALGFVTGYSDGTFDINESMTRAEYAAILAKLALASGVDSDKVYFYDVPSTHWAKNAVNIACSQGMMSGEGKYFRPDDALTLEEASQGLVVLLGYNYAKQANVSNTFIAASLGIYKNVSLGGKLTRGDILTAVYNALSVDMVASNEFDSEGNITGEITKGENILSRNFDIFKSKGQFTAIGDIDLVRVANDNTGFIRIDDIQYELAKEVKVDKSLLAYNIEFYYHDAGDSSRPVLLYYSVDEDNEVVQADAGKIIPGSSTTTQLVYLNEKDRENEQSISASARFIVNGHIIADRDKSDSLFDLEGGYVKIVTPENGLNQIVWIYRYEYHMASAAGVKVLFLEDGTQVDLDNDKEDLEASVYTAAGEPATLNDITANSGVALAEVVAADGKTYRSVYILKILSGVVSEIGDDIIIIDGKEYGKADSLNAEKVQLGFSYTFFAGMDGKICLYSTKPSDTLVFGYLIDAGAKSKGLSPTLQLKIMTVNGDKKIYDTSDNLYVNNTNVKKDAFFRDNSIIYQYLYNKAASRAIRQVVGYKENAEGKITEIYTPSSDPLTNNVLKLDVPQAKRQCKSGAIFNFGGELTVKDSGAIFAVPADLDAAEEDDFEAWSTGYFQNDTSYTVEGYNVNELLEADVIVATVDGADTDNYDSGNSYTCVFDKKSTVLLEDGTQSYSITYWQQGTKYTKALMERSGQKTYAITLKAVESLSRGDCFMIELTTDKSKVKNISIEFQQANRMETTDGYNSIRKLLYGRIEAIGPNSLVIRKFTDSSGSNYLGSTACLYKNAARVSTYLYTGDDRSIQYLPNCLADARVGDWVLCQSRYEAPRTMVIYRDDDRLPNGKLLN